MIWHSIESAPLDGTRVLLHESGYTAIGSYTTWARDDDGNIIGLEHSKKLRDYWEWDGEGFKANPSHWMPLPKKP